MKLDTKEIKRIAKVAFATILFALMILVLFDFKNIQKDIHNYNEIQEIRKVLDSKDKEKYKFKNLYEFNSLFQKNIQPEGNCYFVSVSL